MLRAAGLSLAAALALTLSAAARAEEIPPPPGAFVAARAHLVYRADAHSPAVEGRVTVLEQRPAVPCPPKAKADCPQPEALATLRIMELALLQR